MNKESIRSSIFIAVCKNLRHQAIPAAPHRVSLGSARIRSRSAA